MKGKAYVWKTEVEVFEVFSSEKIEKVRNN